MGKQPMNVEPPSTCRANLLQKKQFCYDKLRLVAQLCPSKILVHISSNHRPWTVCPSLCGAGRKHRCGNKCGLLLVSVGIITHRILYVFYCIHCIHVQYIQCVYIVLHYISFSVALILMYSCSGCIQMYSWTCGATLECHTAFMCIRSLCCIRISFSTSHI